MSKVILLTNILTPYRIYFYELLHKEFESNGVEFKILVTSSSEPNRNWNYEDLKRDFTFLAEGKVFTISNIYIHINIGIGEFIKKEKPSLVISAGSYMYPALWTVINLKRKLPFKLIYWNEAHLNEQRSYSKVKIAARELIRKFIFKKFDGFWHGGVLSTELIEKYALVDSPKMFVPNLIDDKLFRQKTNITNDEWNVRRQKADIGTKKIVLFCPARMTWVKGQLDFLKFINSCPDLTNLTIVFAGEGELRHSIEEVAKTISNGIEIKFVGYLSQEETIYYYSISNFLLLPSYSDPNPLTCIEALWCGLSLCISYNVGNYPEILMPGLNGYIFEMNENFKICEVLKNIKDSDEGWFLKSKEVSLKIAREKYQSESSTKRIVLETLNLFQ
jgi:hypothetical protein